MDKFFILKLNLIKGWNRSRKVKTFHFEIDFSNNNINFPVYFTWKLYEILIFSLIFQSSQNSSDFSIYSV